MLSKKERLSRVRFNECFTQGRRSHGLYSTCITTPSQTFGVAVVVGKKVAKKAHERNTLRRRLYGLVAGLLSAATKPSLNLIIIAKPAIKNLSRREIIDKLTAEIGRGLNNR